MTLALGLPLPYAIAQTCGTQNQFCNSNEACDDGDPCNGTETCSPPDIIRFCRCDSTPPCDDGDPCTRDTCTRLGHGILCHHDAGGCSDGIFCNGLEVCNHGSCQGGSPPCADPLICDEANDRCVECFATSDCGPAGACRTVSCNASTGQCEFASCLDNSFCNGRELCLSSGGCAPGVPPCPEGAACEEGALRCNQCANDAECADDDSCSIEFCDDWSACHNDGCKLSFDSPANGSIFAIGEMVDIDGRGPHGLDLALVLDESGSIDANDFQTLKDFARSLVQSFALGETTTKVGVTMFSSGARRVLNMSSNQSLVLSTINAISQRGGATCIGCGVDDGSANLMAHGRAEAVKIMIVVTDGQNNVPSGIYMQHLEGALQAARVHEQVIFAVGVGDGASQTEIQHIATEVPGVGTAFMVSGFAALQTVRNALVMAASISTTGLVPVTLPDGTQQGFPLSTPFQFRIPDWVMLPGENVFTAEVSTLDGPKQASLTLIGVYRCTSTCGDLDADGDVDLRDTSESMLCFSARSWHSPVCGCGDLNGDTKIDLTDHAGFVAALESPNTTVPPNCPIP